MGRIRRGERKAKSIFRAIFIPLILLMLLQAGIFYFAAVYGGIEDSLNQNAADILSERLINEKNVLEARFNNRSFGLRACAEWLSDKYAEYEAINGEKPLAKSPQLQIEFLNDCADILIDTLRQNETNGVFLILNDQLTNTEFERDTKKKYGLCIRDMDQDSNYFAREDLLIERSPSSIVESVGCSLDSWWEAFFTFESEAGGDYYYCPLNAAWAHPGADGVDLAYFAGVHHLSVSDHAVISYSIPLIDAGGYPFGVVGVELTTQYLASLLPNNGPEDLSLPCYVLALRQSGSDVCVPIIGAGALYTRCFGAGEPILTSNAASTGGFFTMCRGDIELYGDDVRLSIYNNNNPFDDDELVLLALAEKNALFAHISRVKRTLFLVSLGCLMLGIVAISIVSRRFAAPVTALARRVKRIKPRDDFELGRLGILEIDQLVESIEELNRNVSRSSARTEFFSRMSHDMRTPMNAIISFSSRELLDGADDETKNDFFEKIHASGVYLLGLINEVLDMTKIESDKVEMRLEPIQAARLFDTTLPIIEKLAQEKRVEFARDITGDDGVYLSADVLHLNQILMNLLSNAVKFTPEGGTVWLKIILAADAGDPETIRVSIVVKDNGIGMSEAFMKNLFSPFEQENEAREGTGLGLSIANKLVKLMHGDISCESRRGAGTTFTVRLPLKKHAAVPDNTRRSAYDDAELISLAGKRVLLCEDNALNTQIMCRLLDKVGIITDVAENGEAGLNKFAASPPHTYNAIIMDVRMPVMDGLTATRRIRALDRPDALSVPIIAMTANAFDEDARASKLAGMNEHLAKPIETGKFFTILRHFIIGDDN